MTLSLVGCSTTSDLNESSRWTSVAPSPTSPVTTTPTKKDAAPVDYSSLLLTAEDLSDEDDNFALRSSTPNPNGLPGASALFVNDDDTRAISATFAIYPDPATATATLRQALTKVDSVVVGTPQPSRVGTDGTLIRGNAPDGAKAVTLLFFTQGPALVRLEFQSAVGDATTDRYVTAVGKMQRIALRVGLPAGS
ncbi:hypothetical protein [Mycobacterium sp. ACS4331]|uniref:hypothetical protein n=1 Tax=Mycobacterium sp. ACS4331 TaxID=1834121 RepID=UPI0007FC23D9|nr:hypothetical protein [Mycobacterium sp. ACS4331]OBF16611.1 hypothetical protein A5727_13630 [Mycobacterium sp. ACS4331]